MKIKLTHTIAKEIAQAAKDAVEQCIEKNQMSETLEVSDIKGKVTVAHAGQAMLANNNTYQYTVSLFNNIHLVTGAIYVQHSGLDQSIERTVMSAIGAMVQVESGPAAITPRIHNTVITAMGNPCKRTTFELWGEMTMDMLYKDTAGNHSFSVVVSVGDRIIAEYNNCGETQASVVPTATGIFGVLVQQASSFMPTKEKEFYITEFTTFHNPGMLFGGPSGMPLAMTNQHPGGAGVFGEPANLYNPTSYAGPNYRTANGNDPFSHF